MLDFLVLKNMAKKCTNLMKIKKIAFFHIKVDFNDLWWINWSPWYYFQTKSDLLDNFLLSGSLCIARVRVRTHRSQLTLWKLWIAALLANTFRIDGWLDIYSFDVIGTNCGLFLARITKLLLRHNPIDFCFDKCEPRLGKDEKRLI